MPVTFGTVQVVPPAIAPQSAGGGGGAAAGAGTSTGGDPVPPAPRPRELLPVVRQLHDRAARVRAH